MNRGYGNVVAKRNAEANGNGTIPAATFVEQPDVVERISLGRKFSLRSNQSSPPLCFDFR
jgi:hypothetical protein